MTDELRSCYSCGEKISVHRGECEHCGAAQEAKPRPPPPKKMPDGSTKSKVDIQSGYVTTGPAVTSNYRIIGIVGARADNTDSEDVPVQGCGGCGGGSTATRVHVSPNETYQRAAQNLMAEAKQSGGDAVIHTQFEHRIAVETLGIGKSATSSQVFEIVCVGTAIKILR